MGWYDIHLLFSVFSRRQTCAPLTQNPGDATADMHLQSIEYTTRFYIIFSLVYLPVSLGVPWSISLFFLWSFVFFLNSISSRISNGFAVYCVSNHNSDPIRFQLAFHWMGRRGSFCMQFCNMYIATVICTVCPEKMNPLNIFVLASEKLPWIEHSLTYTNLQVFGLFFPKFVQFHCTI